MTEHDTSGESGPVFDFQVPDAEDGCELRLAVAAGVFAAYGDPSPDGVDADGNVDPAHVVDRVTAWLTRKYPFMDGNVDHEMRSADGKIEYRTVSPWMEMVKEADRG